MGMKYYNPLTKQWETVATKKAEGVSIADTKGYFNKNKIKNVENCLEETMEIITDIKKDVKYIYENGTIGGGGGGGSSVFPKIELQTPTEIIVKTDSPFTISYFFQSPNPGDGTANYVLTKKNSLEPPIIDIKKSIKQGKNSYTFEPLQTGEYELSISAVDSTGIGTNNIVCSITSGALEITTNEELSRDISLGEPVTIAYKLSSIFKEGITVKITKPDGTIITEVKNPGTYALQLDPFESLGVKKLTIEAEFNDVKSNVLTFLFIVTDSSTMFMSTTFEGGQFRSDMGVTINYRISLIGGRKFLTDVYLDGNLYESDIDSKNGHNFYTFTNLEIGFHDVVFKARTLESVNPVRAELAIPRFEVVSAEFKNYQFSRDSLVISLDARRGKSNTQSPEKREVWEDTEGKPLQAKLYNFAFNQLNGWVPKSEEDLTVEGLRFSGKSYAEIDLRPLNSELKNGLTIEIRYKNLDITTDNNGNYSTIFDCYSGGKTSGKGIMVDTKEAFVRTSYADSVYNEPNENEWVTQTFVINKANNEILIYTNGAISSFSKINKMSDLLVNKTIILGARRNESGHIERNSNCLIQTLRIYDRVLDDLEVFKNYVSDLPLEEQDVIIAMQEGQLQIPTLKLKFDEKALGSASATTNVDIEYSNPSDPSKNLILYNSIIQKQGTTSLTYPVSNYTIKLYDGGIPFDFAPKDDWIPENVFTLKADYMDSSHANNTGIAAYVSEVFKRLGVKNPAQKENENVKNTIDGFMINLYINGTNRGLYNFNTDRYGAKNYGLSSTSVKTVACSYEANSNTGNATGFHTQDFNLIKSAFKVRYFKGETDPNKYLTYDNVLGQMVLTQGVHKEFINLIKWINEAGTEDTKRFYSEFKEHMDVDHTLLYILTVEIFGLMDNLEKNMVLTYFGEQYNNQTGMLDEVWFPQLYDLDSSVGLSNNGELKYQPCVNFTQEPGMPPDHQYNGTTSVLWTAIKKHFEKELRDLYARLRSMGLLSYDTLLEYYAGKTIDQVSPYYYSVDARLKYINPSASGGKDTYYHFCKGRRIEFTRKWLKNRIQFLDSVYEYGNENNPDGDFWKYIQARYLRRNDYDTEFVLKLKSTTPIFVVIVDDSMQTDGKKYFISNDKLYDIRIPINSSADGAMFGVTFGPKITELKFSDNIRLSSLYLEHGRSIYDLNLANNKDLVNIVLNNCENLRSFNVSGCTKLGSQLGMEKINFTNCPNIKNINISNTALSGFLVNENGGVLENIQCDRSNIETFILKHQPYINALNIIDCNNLKKFELLNCGKVSSVSLPTSIINTFRVMDCPNITTITISNTPYLSSGTDITDLEKRPYFLIDNCPKLVKLIMSGLTSNEMTYLDLINVENIEYIDISGCSYLSEIRFSEAANKLNTFICDNSYINHFKIGRSGSVAEQLDLGHFPKITRANFDNCRNLKKVINSTLGKGGAIEGSAIFRNCVNLTSIEGSLYLKGSMTQAFYNCVNLTKLPADIDLSGVTSASEAFSSCKLFTVEEAKRIMSHLINLSGSTWRMFDTCLGIISTEDKPFPEDFFRFNSKMTTIDLTFAGCKNIKGPYPNKLYSSLINLVYIRSPFSSCGPLEVPILGMDDIFKTNVKLQTLHEPFTSVKFLRLPNAGFLSKAVNLKSIIGLFRDQTEMIKSSDAGSYFINENFFKANPLLENISFAFSNCTGLFGDIPPNLLANNKKLKITEYFLFNVPVGGELSENFIPYEIVGGVDTSYLLNVRYMFYGTNIYGNISDKLFEKHKNLSDMSYVFANCHELGTRVPSVKFPNKIFRGKRNLNTVRGIFQGCDNYPISFDSNNINDNNLLVDNINLVDISYLFDGCKLLSGTLPDDMFNIKSEEGDYLPNKIINAVGVFKNTNIGGKVPHTLFKSFMNVTDLAEFFYLCYNLEGGIPYDLFDSCYKLQKVDYFLAMSWDGHSRKIGLNRDNVIEKYIDEVTGFAYLFNKNLFMNCSKLESIRGFLFTVGAQFAGKIHPETFMGNPELKNISQAFSNSGAEIDLTRDVFSRNKKLTLFEDLFYSAKGPIVIHEDWISDKTHDYVWRDTNGKIIHKNFGAAFASSSVVGTTPKLWIMYPSAVSSSGGINCFTYSNISNLDEVPSTWK